MSPIPRRIQAVIMVLFMMLCPLQRLMAQPHDEMKNYRYIYLWDVTLSMKGYGGAPNIWKEVTDNIINDITSNLPNSPRNEIVVIPFQTDFYCKPWRQRGDAQGKAELIRQIRQFDTDQVSNTDIGRPLTRVIDEILSPDKIDVMKLLTDGKTQNEAAFKAALRHWCAEAQHKDAYGYYIMLTDNAADEAVVQDINATCRFEPLHGTEVEIVQISPTWLMSHNLLDEDEVVGVNFRTMPPNANIEGYTVGISDHPSEFYFIKEDKATIHNNEITLTLVPKMMAEEIVNLIGNGDELLLIDLEDDPKYPRARIIPNSVRIKLVTKPEKTLRFSVK